MFFYAFPLYYLLKITTTRSMQLRATHTMNLTHARNKPTMKLKFPENVPTYMEALKRPFQMYSGYDTTAHRNNRTTNL